MHHNTGRLELELPELTMDKNQDYIAIKSSDNTSWYTEEFISTSIENYLKENGYKVQKENQVVAVDKNEIVIIASRYFTKEIIGVKGLQSPNPRSSLLKVMDKSSSSHVKSWFSESLFNSFVNFGKYYSDESAVVAMALPNVDRYKAIISKVADYFTSNNLSFKIYLVSENGEVEVSNLNTNT
jgi:hypothetical protein